MRTQSKEIAVKRLENLSLGAVLAFNIRFAAQESVAQKKRKVENKKPVLDGIRLARVSHRAPCASPFDFRYFFFSSFFVTVYARDRGGRGGERNEFQFLCIQTITNNIIFHMGRDINDRKECVRSIVSFLLRDRCMEKYEGNKYRFSFVGPHKIGSNQSWKLFTNAIVFRAIRF